LEQHVAWLDSRSIRETSLVHRFHDHAAVDAEDVQAAMVAEVDRVVLFRLLQIHLMLRKIEP